MWTCPKCKQQFVNRNQSHSCGHFTVDSFLLNKSPLAVKLFRTFLQKYSEVGDYKLHPVKTRVALFTQMRFASINKLGKDYLDGHLVLTEPHDDEPVFRRIENLGNRFFIHHFRIRKPSDINDVLMRYMRSAYKIGQREHIKAKKR